MNIDQLYEFLETNAYPKYRADQAVRAVFVDGVDSFLDVAQLPKDIREKLHEEVPLLPFKVLRVYISQNKDAIKALFKLEDGNIIESVLISPKPGHWSACISCQVGCAMACSFCATGKIGIRRDLSIDEITSQVLFWKQYLRREKIAGEFYNIVYMGMGEPFMNWNNVKKSIDIFSDEKLFNFSCRKISVSTSGVVPGIKKFTDEYPQVNLAISLHFSTNKKRSEYMPVNKGYDMEQLKDALQYYFSKNNRKIFIEYIMLSGINDSANDANELVNYLKKIGSLHLLHVNLIRYNAIGKGFAPATKNATHAFQNILHRTHIKCTIRKSIGDDIQGACGQLAGGKM